MDYLKDKKIVLGVTAGAAIWKSLDLVRRFKEHGATVYPVLTRNAAKLVSPQLFSAMAGNQAQVRMFSQHADPMGHIRLQKADLLCCAPVGANFIGKVANGIADDFLTTTVMAFSGPIVIAPAMNTTMWEKAVLQENLRKIEATICGPAFGDLTCGVKGVGRMADVAEILDYCNRELAPNDLEGKRVLVTAGPTQEMIDDVRFVSNRSSGRMGYALAKEAWFRGADVTLVSGPVSIDEPYDVDVVKVQTADEMFSVVVSEFSKCDYFISAAAVADFKPEKINGKIKKGDGVPDLKFTKTDDILGWCSKNKKGGQFIIGFALEDGYLKERTQRKLIDKGCDLMIGNGLGNMGASGGYVVMVYESGVSKEIFGDKGEIASQVFDMIG